MTRQDFAPVLGQALADLKRNDTDHAEKLLAHALTIAGDDTEALRLMGVVRAMQGRAAEAERYYRQALACDPHLWQVHHNLGNLLRVQGRFEESVAEQREAIGQKANHAEAHLGLALALSALGDHEAAEKSCREALRIQPNYQLAKQTLVVELLKLHRPTQAEQLLRQMLALGVADRRVAALLEHNLGIALTQQERYGEALVLFDAAEARDPDLPAIDYNRANTLQQIGEFAKAKIYYERASARDPRHAPTLALLALMCALTSDYEGARTFGERTIALAPRHPVALIALAIVDLEGGNVAAANEKLQRVLDDPELKTDKQASFTLGYAADAFDRHGHVAQAFALYCAANGRWRDIHAARFETCRAIDETQRLAAQFETCGSWRDTSASSSATGAGEPLEHVFLLGFMRCGTTLLETILASNDRVVGSDEVEFLTEAAREFLLDEAGLTRLAALGDNEAARWRNNYWKLVAKAGLSVGGRVFVDKMPFNSLRLPLISRLFPGARILLAVRDPRDVVLSCFRRRFNPTPYSFEFLRLDDCARFYDRTMALVERYREKLPLNLREHRYEDMVSGFDTSVRAVCDFIGIEWSASMRDFERAAHTIDSRSASAEQVRRGLYGSAVGQWRRYAEHMAPVLPLLDPWVRKFGYA
jgi:tetratricopeptide (TPR) repeat protein